MLDVQFPLDGVSDALVPLHIDEALQAVALGEARDKALAMLVGAAADVGRDARIEDAVDLAAAYALEGKMEEAEARFGGSPPPQSETHRQMAANGCSEFTAPV